MILYLDNIRGFKKQEIELNEFNFLIGENSTGKSTIISLISLFTQTFNNYNGEFKNEFVDFGTFEDIVSKNSREKKYFLIGHKKQSFNLGKLDYDEILFKYSNSSGFPVVDSFSIKQNDKYISVFFLETEVKYAIFQLDDNNKVTSKKWYEYHINTDLLKKNENFSLSIKDLNPSSFTSQFKVSPLMSLLFVSTQFKDKYKKEFDFNFVFGHDILGKSIWIDPLRSKPQRFYEPSKIKYSGEGNHIPTLLRDIFLNSNTKESRSIIEGLISFGKASGLFDDIKVDQFRKSNDAPFSLNFKLKNKSLKISNIGYGISQIIPILTEILRQSENCIFLIQQPEVHLHPKSQAFFGDFLFQQFLKGKKHFIIETHSDFIIDRFRSQIKKTSKVVNSKVNVLFFEFDGRNNIVTKIELDKQGNYSDNQPKAFRDFFLKEELNMIDF